MTTKLTLSVEKDTIEKAKRFAERQNKSLSRIVESYLEYLTDDAPSTEVDPEVLALSDTISPNELPDIDDLKYQFLRDKHLGA